jgi:hypothetical protein
LLFCLQLKALSTKFAKVRAEYNDCQAEIVQRAVAVAATYASIFRDIGDKMGTCGEDTVVPYVQECTNQRA